MTHFSRVHKYPRFICKTVLHLRTVTHVAHGVEGHGLLCDRRPPPPTLCDARQYKDAVFPGEKTELRKNNHVNRVVGLFKKLCVFPFFGFRSVKLYQKF